MCVSLQQIRARPIRVEMVGRAYGCTATSITVDAHRDIMEPTANFYVRTLFALTVTGY